MMDVVVRILAVVGALGLVRFLAALALGTPRKAAVLARPEDGWERTRIGELTERAGRETLVEAVERVVRRERSAERALDVGGEMMLARLERERAAREALQDELASVVAERDMRRPALRAETRTLLCGVLLDLLARGPSTCVTCLSVAALHDVLGPFPAREHGAVASFVALPDTPFALAESVGPVRDGSARPCWWPARFGGVCCTNAGRVDPPGTPAGFICPERCACHAPRPSDAPAPARREVSALAGEGAAT